MNVLVIASQKGGVGKTTLAAHLAVEAEARGEGPVYLIDMDPQGSLADWWNAREAESPMFLTPSLAELPAVLEQLRKAGAGMVVIDTPPSLHASIRSVAELADLVVIPSRPSPLDLRAVGATIQTLDGLDKPMIFVINGANARARITNQAAIALSQHGPIATTIIQQRTDFPTSMIDGRTVGELEPGGKSAAEVTELYTYLRSHAIKQPRVYARKGATA